MVVLTLGPTRGGSGVDVTPHKRIKHQYLTFSVPVRSFLSHILRQV